MPTLFSWMTHNARIGGERLQFRQRDVEHDHRGDVHALQRALEPLPGPRVGRITEMVRHDGVLRGRDPRFQVIEETRIGTKAARRARHGKLDDDGRMPVARKARAE